MDQNVPLGGTATFTVTVTSGTALSYQWYKDGLLDLDTKVSGATSDKLTISNVSLLDGGTFYVVITNGGGTATSQHATLTAGLLNSPPVAKNDSYTTPEDVSLTTPASGILANDIDLDGNTLTAVLVSTVAHGNLSLNPNGSFSYTPVTNYNGADSFTYAVYDGAVTGNVATVSINVTPVNDPPIVVNDTASVAEDGTVIIRVLDNDSDPEGSSLKIISTFTTNGIATIIGSGNGGRIQFTPATNYNGTVVLSYTVSDGTLSSTGSVTVTVTPVNDAPVANDDTYTTPENMRLTVPVVGVLSNNAGAGVLANDTDVEGDALTAGLVSTVSHGTLALNTNGSFTYMPAADYNGPDSFTYRARDGSLAGNVATVTINVTPVSDPLRFTSMQMTPGGFELQVTGDAAPYVISASSDLQDWTPIFTNAAPSGVLVYTDTTAQNYPSRFYRIDTR